MTFAGCPPPFSFYQMKEWAGIFFLLASTLRRQSSNWICITLLLTGYVRVTSWQDPFTPVPPISHILVSKKMKSRAVYCVGDAVQLGQVPQLDKLTGRLLNRTNEQYHIQRQRQDSVRCTLLLEMGGWAAGNHYLLSRPHSRELSFLKKI